MSLSSTIFPASICFDTPGTPQAPPVLALAVVWAGQEPSRLGEVFLLPPHPGRAGWLMGRGEPEDDAPYVRTHPTRQSPGKNEHAGWLATGGISRKQLRLLVRGERKLEVVNVGRPPMLVNGARVPGGLAAGAEDKLGQQRIMLEPGDVIEILNQLVLLCVERPAIFPAPSQGLKPKTGRFGRPDPTLLVGESPLLWQLRMEVTRLAQASGHVLIRGASGTGKELAACAIHRLSPHGQRDIVSRNAATFPHELIDAELFGNLKNYPNVGMQERPGLIGQADGSTLFLDEVGELSRSAQTHLLRVLDAGEYQRLGEATARRARVRFVGATNQPPDVFREDFVARFDWTLELPGLNERREDIPLLVRELFRRQALQSPELARQYCENGDPQGMPRVSPQLMSALIRHQYSTHMRELAGLLRRAVRDSGALHYLELAPALRSELGWPERPSLLSLGHMSATQQRPGLQDVRRPREESLSFQEHPTMLCDPSARESKPLPHPDAVPTETVLLERWLDEETKIRLARFREVGFSPSAYAALEGCSRMAANTWLQRLLFRVVVLLDFRCDAAMVLLAGSPEGGRRLQRRFDERLDDLRTRLQHEGKEAMAQKLKALYGPDGRYVLAVLERCS